MNTSPPAGTEWCRIAKRERNAGQPLMWLY